MFIMGVDGVQTVQQVAVSQHDLDWCKGPIEKDWVTPATPDHAKWLAADLQEFAGGID